MSPICYVEYVRDRYQSAGAYEGTGFSEYQWSRFESSPWTPLRKPLSQCRVAILSSSGASLKDQPPFDPAGKNDLSFREIPKTARTGDVVINHNFYDHGDAQRDLNCVLPLDRFQELADEGIIGELAPVHYTFMGRIFSRKGIAQTMAPDLVRRLQAQQVDLLFQIPT